MIYDNLKIFSYYALPTIIDVETMYKAIIEGKKDEVVKVIKSMDENNLNLQDRYRASLTESLLRQANQTSLADKVQEQNR